MEALSCGSSSRVAVETAYYGVPLGSMAAAPRAWFQLGDAIGDVFVENALVVGEDSTYVAYYDGERRMSVAASERGHETTSTWRVAQLDSELGWDSHNDISLGVDEHGHVHVAGNMHVSPLEYYRTEKPGKIETLRRASAMVNPEHERRVTYPRFIRARDGGLTFWFRDGTSGDGVQRVYVLEPDQGTWRAAAGGGVLLDGEGERSAYLDRYRATRGPDGLFHMVWVWRRTPDAETTHDVCYARSEDLDNWFSVDGSALELPLRHGSEAVLVQAVPEGSGLINNNVRLGFDAAGAPVIAGHVRDSAGRLQIVLWRYSAGSWRDEFLTDWDLEWNFAGKGSLDFPLELGSPIPVSPTSIGLDMRYGGAVARVVVTAGGDVDVVPSRFPWVGIGSVPVDGGPGFAFTHEMSGARGGCPVVIWRAVRPNRDMAPHPSQQGRSWPVTYVELAT